jgi:glycosyltransferase involved in cell wall biosynthesis
MIREIAFAPRRGNIIAPMSLTPAVPSPHDKPIRVVIQQPNLARYRLPVYQELAKRPGIDLHLVYGDDGTVPSVPPEGFKATLAHMRIFKVLGSEVRWHGAQVAWTDPKQVDVVVLSWSTRYLSLVPGLLKARRKGLGSVLWGHGYSKAETGLSAKTRNRVSDLADALLFYNRTTADQFIADGRSSSERVFVALNALDQSQISAARESWLGDPARLEAFQRQHDLAGTPNLLFVSRFDHRNRVDLLLEAVARLQNRYPAMLINLVGKGPEEADLRARARSLGIASKVRFLGAIYNEQELAPWFLSATAFVYPSNIGLSLLHSFGYGLPVITSDDRAAQNPEFEALKPGINGLTYSAGDAEGLAGAIAKVCESATTRDQLATNAYQTTAQEFTLRRMVDGMEAAIRYAAVKARRVTVIGFAVFSARFLADPATWCML